MAPSRRYRLTRPPDARSGPEVVVRQVFWRLGDGFVLRLRREGPAGEPSDDSLTVRGPGARWTLPLDPAPETVGALFRAGAGHRVVALRRRHRLDGRDWDVDDYQWENAGLVLARPLDGGPPPATWAARDVTAEPAYDEENLAYAPFTSWPAPSR